jgi:hypothetical protein
MLRTVLVVLSSLATAACSPAGFRDWATQLQDGSARGLVAEQNERELSTWAAAGDSTGYRRVPLTPEPAAEEAKPAEVDTPAPPQYIVIVPTR